MIYRVPKRFYLDHVLRSDELVGVVVKELSTKFDVELDADQFAELLSDANYYNDNELIGEMGFEYAGLISSAGATVRALTTTKETT